MKNIKTVSQTSTPRNRSVEQDYRIRHPYWQAILSDGQVVTDDIDVPSAWQNLKAYCDETGLYVKVLSLHFRKNKIEFPLGKDGYFVRKSILASFGNFQRNFFLLGYVDGDNVRIEKWSVPELTFEEIIIRTVEESDNSIIWKK